VTFFPHETNDSSVMEKNLQLKDHVKIRQDRNMCQYCQTWCVD